MCDAIKKYQYFAVMKASLYHPHCQHCWSIGGTSCSEYRLLSTWWPFTHQLTSLPGWALSNKLSPPPAVTRCMLDDTNKLWADQFSEYLSLCHEYRMRPKDTHLFLQRASLEKWHRKQQTKSVLRADKRRPFFERKHCKWNFAEHRIHNKHHGLAYYEARIIY